MTLKDAMMDDMRRMEDIAADCGVRANASPYIGDSKKTDRFFWAVAVAVLHLLLAEIKRRERDGLR